MIITKEGIKLVANKEVFQWPERWKWKARDKDMKFKACIGISAEIVADIWNRILVHAHVRARVVRASA